MKVRQWLHLGLIVAATSCWQGCASKPSGNAPQVSQSTSPKPFDEDKYQELIDQFSGKSDPFEKLAMGQPNDNAFTSAMKKAGGNLKNALTIKSKVVPAGDPVSLSTPVPEFGPDLYQQAARLAEQKGRYDAALEQYDKALAAVPEFFPAMVGKARLFDRAGQFEKAVELYQQALDVAPEQPAIHNDLGLCYARNDRFEDAIQSLEEAVRLAPTQARYRNNLATVLVTAGRTDDALSHLLAANDAAVAHYNLGFLLKEAGRTRESAHHLQQALLHNQELGAARQLLASLPTEPAPNVPSPPTRTPTVYRSVSDPGPASQSLQQVQHTGPPVSQRTETAQPQSFGDIRMPGSFSGGAAAPRQGEAVPPSPGGRGGVGDGSAPRLLPPVQ